MQPRAASLACFEQGRRTHTDNLLQAQAGPQEGLYLQAWLAEARRERSKWKHSNMEVSRKSRVPRRGAGNEIAMQRETQRLGNGTWETTQ